MKIKVCDTAPKSACSYYRGLGPLSKLNKINSDIQVEYIESVSWPILTDCDILFMVRPVEKNYIETIKMAKNFGVTVWSDFDDCLMEIPEFNPVHNYYQQPDIKDNILFAIKHSDIVTVSTQHIKDYFSYINPDIIVIENAFNDYNYQLLKKNNSEKYITWRGSNTHRTDLLSCKESMSDLSKNFPEWEWYFIGGDPWYIADDIEKSAIVKELELLKYNDFIEKVSPSIHIIPLLDIPFNHSKSNIAWIEGTYAGACCIAPDLPEFRKPGCITYKEDFKYLMTKMIKSKSFRQENYEKSLKYIRENLLLSQINQKRIKIIEEVI